MLSIEITRECPLSCPGCYAYGESHLGSGVTLRELNDLRGDALVNGVLELVRKHKPMHVSLVGGEPLVRHRELSRILPALSELGVFTLVVTSAVIPIPIEWMKIPRLRVAVSVDGLPAFCRVAGVIRPTTDSAIRFEVWMPESAWNERFLGVGNGGFAGVIGYGGLAANLRRGFATAGTDTGHDGEGEDASWAYQHPEKIKDFGWRGVHLTTERAKQVVQAFYGRPARRSYFDSCSDGGREALMEAQRFPEDYDGILAGAPANNWTGLISSGIDVTQVTTGDPAGCAKASFAFSTFTPPTALRATMARMIAPPISKRYCTPCVVATPQ